MQEVNIACAVDADCATAGKYPGMYNKCDPTIGCVARRTVFLGSRPKANAPGTCTIDALDDPTRCYACTQVNSCLNTCGTCEVCAGAPLPTGCSCQSCDDKQLCQSAGAPCGSPCPAGQFCLQGCCTNNPN